MSSTPTFRDFALTTLDQRKEAGVRGLVSERNRFMLHIVGADFAKKPLAEIHRRDIRDWLRVMRLKKAADTRGDRLICIDTIKRSFALVSAIFSNAVEDDLLDSSPCSDVKVGKRADEHSTRTRWTWLTLDEQKLIVACDAIPFMDRLMIRFATGTGLRQGEQSNLELPDIHIGHDNPRVVVRYGSRNHLPPKNGKVREVPLFGDALVVAKLWLYELATYAPENPHNLVFPTPRGTHRGVGKPLGRGPKLREYLALLGITRRVRWHDLRHSFCSNLVSGVLGRPWSLSEVRDAAGHSSVTQTERYAHLGPEAIARAGRETTFTHGPLLPLVPAAPDTSPVFDAPPAPETERELETWFDEAVAS
jgi:integrase